MEIAAAVASIKSMVDLGKAFLAAKTDEAAKEIAKKLNMEIMALQTFILSIQSEHYDLLKAKSDLERQLIELREWISDTNDYALVELAAGVFAYAREPGIDSGEPMHYICANCYQQQYKSILQRADKHSGGTIYHCPNCKTEYLDHNDKKPLSVPHVLSSHRKKRPLPPGDWNS